MFVWRFWSVRVVNQSPIQLRRNADNSEFLMPQSEVNDIFRPSMQVPAAQKRVMTCPNDYRFRAGGIPGCLFFQESGWEVYGQGFRPCKLYRRPRTRVVSFAHYASPSRHPSWDAYQPHLFTWKTAPFLYHQCLQHKRRAFYIVIYTHNKVWPVFWPPPTRIPIVYRYKPSSKVHNIGSSYSEGNHVQSVAFFRSSGLWINVCCNEGQSPEWAFHE